MRGWIMNCICCDSNLLQEISREWRVIYLLSTVHRTIIAQCNYIHSCFVLKMFLILFIIQMKRKE